MADTRPERQPKGQLEERTSYHSALLTLYAVKDRVRIVQVGANDGVINDPLYPVVSGLPGRTDILLIEPQRSLLPLLRSNYAFHPNPAIFNGAIGPTGVLALYAVREEFWGRFDVPYAKGWPAYRAPTGIASANVEWVRGWVRRYIQDKSQADHAVEQLTVPCKPLLKVMEIFGWEASIDVLQIDTEGFDDQVIYASDIGHTLPALIHFEVNMTANSYARLAAYLSGFGYIIDRHGNDALALRVKPASDSPMRFWT